MHATIIKFNISRIGAVVFSETAYEAFSLTKYKDVKDVASALLKMKVSLMSYCDCS